MLDHRTFSSELADLAERAAETPVAGPGADRPPADARPVLSVVVPTRDEEGNVDPLCAQLREILPGEPVEVLFVDDSDDGTPAAVRRVAARSPRPIRILHRPPGKRDAGLGGAVVEGMRVARGEWVCVMDADLQHPPMLIERLLERARAGGFDLVVASRFQDGGDADRFGPLRRGLSWLCKQGARAMFPRRLRAVSDPMSGFFLVRRDRVDLAALRPRGFKILVEILVRTPRLRVGEVGFHFGERLSGESKAGAREAGRYLAQLASARVGERPLRLARFTLVGASGLAVNTLALALFTSGGHIYYAVSAILATQVSTAWNYALTERWVFRGRDAEHRALHRAALFFATNNAAMLVRIPLLLLLVSGFGINYLVSNVLSLVALTLARFALADTWIWGSAADAATGARRAATWNYDVHGLITVESDVALPELERFLVEELVEHPAIRVRVGGRRDGHEPVRGNGRPPAAVRYREPLRRLGFAVDITIGERTEVRASRLVGWSPHVLYTNVVEPILRWALVERGYALVHAACVADGDRAVLITARTDTGKTTTSLKILDAGRFSFLSDDLTLLCPDGRVLAYPKPLTISRHTLHAVRRPLLGRRERMALVLQSRLHSRSGRRFALLLARTHLPAATINTVTQLLVPPPKYHVDRLVPGVRIASEARVEGLVVIERGGVGEVSLEAGEAIGILLENCEDAYGFPPYHDIEDLLHSRDGARLQEAERATIARALDGVEATLLRSETMDWWTRVPGVLGASPQPAPHPEPAPVPRVPGLEAVPGTVADA